MRKIYLAAIALLLAVSLWAQTTTTIAIVHGGGNRSYIVHLPPGHDANTPTPLVLNFHGYGSNAGQQQFYANMDAVADTAGFIVVYPEGINNAWNAFSGMVATPDDVSFTSAIIDDVNRRYKVDPTRVYACGMSNGGYMSYLLACQLDDRIAAVASVTGLAAPSTIANCNATRPVPVLQIHGTDDATVPYNGGGIGGSVDSTINFWLVENGCPNTPPVIDTLPNTNSTDGSFPISYRTTGCDGGTEVQLIKIVNGGHTWPGAPFPFAGVVTNKDIDGSTVVWDFFSKFTHPNPGPFDTTTTAIKQVDNTKLVKAYPNPMGNLFTVEVTDARVKSIALYDVLGAKIYEASISQLPARIQFSTANLEQGVYFLRVQTNTGQTTYKVMK